LALVLPAHNAAARKKGSEKIMRRVSSVNASTGLLAKASFTMMAFVENSSEPTKQMRNPANEMFFLLKMMAAAGIIRLR